MEICRQESYRPSGCSSTLKPQSFTTLTLQGSAARPETHVNNAFIFFSRRFFGFCFIIFTFLNTTLAQAKNSEVSQAQIIMQNGKKVILTSPISINGEFSNSELVIKRLSVTAVESITFHKKLKKQNIHQLSLRSNNQNFLVSVNKKAKVSGKGEWGKESIPIAKIKSLKLSYGKSIDKNIRKYHWSAKLKSGKNVRLSLSSTGNFPGFIKTEGKSNKFGFSRKYVKLISFTDNTSQIYDIKDKLLMTGWQPSNIKLSGKTWFGSVELKWEHIATLENAAPKLKESIRFAQHRTILKKGTELFLPGLTTKNLRGKIKDIILDVDIEKLASISRTSEQNKQFTLSFNENLKYENFQPQDKHFTASVYYGKLDIPWESLVKFDQVKPPKEKKTKFGASWKLTTKQGMELELQNLKLKTSRRDKTILNGDIQVESFNLNRISKFVPGSDGLEFQLDKGNLWTLTGIFVAESDLGKATFSTNDVANLTKVGSLKNKKQSSKKSKGNTGKLFTTSGREYLVNNLTFNSLKKIHSKKKYWGYKLVKISLGQMELWIDPKKLSSASFTQEGQRVIFDIPEFDWPVFATKVKDVSFHMDLGKFKMNSKSIKSFVSSSEVAAKKNTGKSTFRIQASNKNQSSPFVEITGLQFARYPKRGWVGSYTKSAYPFQWWRANKLYFTRANDGSRIDVEFDKINSINIQGRYRTNRKAVLTNRNGNKLEGAIFPGDVAKRHGTSEWDYSNEGLLGKISNDAYVFIRFNKVTSINIEYD